MTYNDYVKVFVLIGNELLINCLNNMDTLLLDIPNGNLCLAVEIL